MKIVSRSLWTIFLILILAPEVSSSELKGADDQAPQFLFVLHSDQGSYVTESGDLEILQFPKKHISLLKCSPIGFEMSDLSFASPESEIFGSYAMLVSKKVQKQLFRLQA